MYYRCIWMHIHVYMIKIKCVTNLNVGSHREKPGKCWWMTLIADTELHVQQQIFFWAFIEVSPPPFTQNPEQIYSQQFYSRRHPPKWKQPRHPSARIHSASNSTPLTDEKEWAIGCAPPGPVSGKAGWMKMSTPHDCILWDFPYVTI